MTFFDKQFDGDIYFGVSKTGSLFFTDVLGLSPDNSQ